MLEIEETNQAIRVEVKVQPRSSRNQIVGEQNGVLKVKLTAPPIEGEANRALINFLAVYLKIPRKDISLIRGETSRNKLIEIKGITKKNFLLKTGQI
ncbi:MAG: DUF167 domain-containing protein [Syntrophomonadaceae bacterium]|jgi:uncharacterized protein (TIGR00251 family)